MCLARSALVGLTKGRNESARLRLGARCRVDGFMTVARDMQGIPRGAVTCQAQSERLKRGH